MNKVHKISSYADEFLDDRKVAGNMDGTIEFYHHNLIAFAEFWVSIAVAS
jgi:hypothetical protein